ncbi:MAG: hypothetical protein M1819_002095 [Sarea resinae]|nr:MAG: hypothetical protein M1819_002095 [Sarea resinae]
MALVSSRELGPFNAAEFYDLGLYSPPPSATKKRSWGHNGLFDMSWPAPSGLLTPPPEVRIDTPTPPTTPSLVGFPFPAQSSPKKARKNALSLNVNLRSKLPSRSIRCGLYTGSRAPKPALDRFIPLRRSPTSSLDSFHLSKPTDLLSHDERVLRHRSASPDPFSPMTQDLLREAERFLPGRIRRSEYNPGLSAMTTTGVLGLRRFSSSIGSRHGSFNAAHMDGILTGPLPGITDGRGGMIGSGTNAPLYISRFLEGLTPNEDLEKHERRLAVALEIGQAERVLQFSSPENRCAPKVSGNPSPLKEIKCPMDFRTTWRDNEWVREGGNRVLDAPQLRDDFYCSLIAYSITSKALAVGLNTRVYLWSEVHGVQYPPHHLFLGRTAYVTSLSFSSDDGANSILAMGRADGQISLWSLYELEARFDIQQAHSISCMAFNPRNRGRPSLRDTSTKVCNEDLLVGDEVGDIYYYAVEWPTEDQRTILEWDGALSMLFKISVHTQQICGLTWSPDGNFFASGGNDNVCCHFDTSDIAPLRSSMNSVISEESALSGDGATRPRFIIRQCPEVREAVQESHRWYLSAAVKALAFCPWQSGLIAVGGGSNDRCIHFYHTISGACLATISVAAQVTSLIWSTSRREIAATFGYAQPDHPYRIAVFSWPSCQQIVAIPWAGEMRALYAIPYPGGPNLPVRAQRQTEGGQWLTRTAEEGCIVVASSDESVKFHEIWSEAKQATYETSGLLGGSDILESLHGIDKDGLETIR